MTSMSEDSEISISQIVDRHNDTYSGRSAARCLGYIIVIALLAILLWLHT